jgi:hypothetical protein
MRAAKSIRYLAVVALLPLSVMGCFEGEDLPLEIVGSEYRGGACHVRVRLTNNLSEPIDRATVAPLINGEHPFGTWHYLDARDLNVGENEERTLKYRISTGQCDAPEISEVSVVYGCETASMSCEDKISF